MQKLTSKTLTLALCSLFSMASPNIFQQMTENALKAARLEQYKKVLAIKLSPKENSLAKQKIMPMVRQKYINAVYGNKYANLGFASCILLPSLVLGSDALIRRQNSVAGQAWTKFRDWEPCKNHDQGIGIKIVIGFYSAIPFVIKAVLDAQSCKNNYPRIFNEIKLTDFEEKIVQFITQRAEMDPTLVKILEQCILTWTQNPNIQQNLFDWLSTALALPTTFKKISVDNDPAINPFKNYSKNIQAELLNYSKRARLLGENSKGLNVIYLHGMPGTGKSYAAQEIAKYLDVPYARMSIAGRKIEQIAGSGATGSACAGDLLDAIKTAQVQFGATFKNMVLIIEDVDHVFNNQDKFPEISAYMLQLLDPSMQSKFRNPYLGCDLELPRNIILTGNSVIAEPALRMRFKGVQFDGFDAKAKHVLFWECIIPEILKELNTTLNFENYPVLQNLINQLLMTDKDSGLRTLGIMIKSLLSDFLQIQSYYQGAELEQELALLDEKYMTQLQQQNSMLMTMHYSSMPALGG